MCSRKVLGKIVSEQIRKVHKEPLIKVLTNTRISKLNGSPGDYQASLRCGQQVVLENCGALIIAHGRLSLSFEWETLG